MTKPRKFARENGVAREAMVNKSLPLKKQNCPSRLRKIYFLLVKNGYINKKVEQKITYEKKVTHEKSPRAKMNGERKKSNMVFTGNFFERGRNENLRQINQPGSSQGGSLPNSSRPQPTIGHNTVTLSYVESIPTMFPCPEPCPTVLNEPNLSIPVEPIPVSPCAPEKIRPGNS